MESVSDVTDSRAATNALLAGLREGRLAPAAVARFLAHAAHRSLRQAAQRPTALTELTALHALLLVLATGRRPGVRWVTVSWALAITHLGLLEHRMRLSGADVLTLIRGNLPALPGGAAPWTGPLAIALDLADGHLARRQGTASPSATTPIPSPTPPTGPGSPCVTSPAAPYAPPPSPPGPSPSSPSPPSRCAAAPCPSGPAPP